jgi:hypothetical protein
MTVSNTEPDMPVFSPYAGESYAELVATAAVMPGGELIAGDHLIGVPFVVTAMTFRSGDFMDAATKQYGSYVSVEIMTGDEKAFARALKRNRITVECPVEPEEMLVFNEGGTGVYRQCVATWEDAGYMTLDEDVTSIKEGKRGESRYDVPLRHWIIPGTSPVNDYFDSEGNPVFSAPIRLSCPRGLRVSEYENEYTKEGRSRYLS